MNDMNYLERCKQCEHWNGRDCRRTILDGGCIYDPVELPLPEPKQFETEKE